MALRWTYQDPNGTAVSGPEITFDTQDEAEEWLGRWWQNLLDSGVETVTLLDGSTEVYEPMSLRP